VLLFTSVIVWFSGILSLYSSTVNCMKLAYSPFRGAGADNDAEIRPFFFYFCRRGRARYLGLECKTHVDALDSRIAFPSRVLRSREAHSRFLPYFVSIYSFFLRLRQRRSCRQQFPGGRRKLRERAASFRRIATFLFSIYVDFRAIPILGSVGCECIVHARILLGGYTVYLRALYRGYVLFRVELRN